MKFRCKCGLLKTEIKEDIFQTSSKTKRCPQCHCLCNIPIYERGF